MVFHASGALAGFASVRGSNYVPSISLAVGRYHGMEGVSHLLRFESHRRLARLRPLERLPAAARPGQNNAGGQQAVSKSDPGSIALHQRGH